MTWSRQHNLTLSIYRARRELAAFIGCLLSLLIVYLLLTHGSSSTFHPQSDVSHHLILISTTSYDSIDSARCQLALQSIERAVKSIQCRSYILIDSSPSDAVKSAFRSRGATVIDEDSTSCGKGCALRQGIKAAIQLIDTAEHDKFESTLESKALSTSTSSSRSSYVIAFFEPEKADFIRFLPTLSSLIFQQQSVEIVLPRRCDECMSSYLPLEQYHSETFANHHLNNIALEMNWSVEDEKFQQLTGGEIDFMFGPVLFRASQADYWLSSTLTDWSAQIIPFIRAAQDYQSNQRIRSVEIAYIHSEQQKRLKSRNALFSQKRFMQLNKVIPTVEAALRQQRLRNLGDEAIR